MDVSSRPFLTTVEVCARLRIDRSTLTRWVGSGRVVAAQKLPGRSGAFLFDEVEVARVERDLAGRSEPASGAA